MARTIYFDGSAVMHLIDVLHFIRVAKALGRFDEWLSMPVWQLDSAARRLPHR